MICIVCNGFEIKSGKNAGLTGVYRLGAGVFCSADSKVVVCPACSGTGQTSERKLHRLIELGFEPSEGPAQLGSESIREAKNA